MREGGREGGRGKKRRERKGEKTAFQDHISLSLFLFDNLLARSCKEEWVNAEAQHGERPHDSQEDATKHGKHNVTGLQAKVGWVRVLGKLGAFGQRSIDASVP